MKLNLNEIKDVISRMASAIGYFPANPEKPVRGLRIDADCIGDVILCTNADSYSVMGTGRCSENNEVIDVVVEADKFTSLISKLNCDVIDVIKEENRLVVKTKTSEYSFPLLDDNTQSYRIFNAETAHLMTIDGDMLASVADTNAKALADAKFSETWQRNIYFDGIGAITFADNVFINDFTKQPTGDVDAFKLLIDGNQANILRSFAGKTVNVYLLPVDNDSNGRTVVFKTDNLELSICVPSVEKTAKFPADKVRKFVTEARNIHVIVDRTVLVNALTRLGIFDKNIDIKVLDYSEIQFDTKGMKLVSKKSRNFEYVPYESAQNPTEYTAIIRFDDLLNRIKVLNSKTVDISYAENGNVHAILVNGNIKELIHENVLGGRK